MVLTVAIQMGVGVKVAKSVTPHTLENIILLKNEELDIRNSLPSQPYSKRI